jgi:DNA-directed RNA polymerase subunit H (RpoH/RPB5)
MVTLDDVWPKSQDDNKKDQLARMTASPFVTPLARFKTVLDAMSYQVKMNDYWWALAKILVANRFDKGKYHLASGTVVYEREPHFFVEEERLAISLGERSVETSKKASATGKLAEKAKEELKKMEESVASLRAKVQSKEAEMEKLKHEESVARAQGEKLKGEVMEIVRKTAGELFTPSPFLSCYVFFFSHCVLKSIECNDWVRAKSQLSAWATEESCAALRNTALGNTTPKFCAEV